MFEYRNIIMITIRLPLENQTSSKDRDSPSSRAVVTWCRTGAEVRVALDKTIPVLHKTVQEVLTART
jgi:hypothetical protein